MEFMARSIGDLYSREGRFDSAAVYLDSAMVLAGETQQFIRIGAVHEVMSDHFARTDDFHEALVHYRLYRSVQDSMLSQRSVEQINELTVRYETDKKDQEISLLQRDKRIADLELQRRAAQLERRRMFILKRERKLEMMAQQREIHDLTLSRQRDELLLSQSQLALNRAEINRKQQALNLQSSILSRENLLRNAIVAVLLLFILLAVFIVRVLREKRRVVSLRASSAEYAAQASAAQAEAAKARALAVQAEGVRRATENQEAFSRQLIASQEQERKRIAGSLHDGIGQDLLIIKHRAMMALEEVNGNIEHLKDILEISTEAIDDVRRISRDLRPYQLERVGLTATLQSMLRAVDESTDLEITPEISDIDGMIAPEREIDLYRVMQEALNNILKHASARQVLVRLEKRNGTLLVTVRDDGRGFDADAACDAAGSGLGLQGMAERVRMLGGELSIESAPGEGTLIRVMLPVAEHAESCSDGP
jgi:signal transduction histidine kinase